MAARKKNRTQPVSRFTKIGLKWWVGVLVLLGILLAITWVREAYRQTSYEISQMNDQYQMLLQKQTLLKTELERLRSPARIMRIAREKLDLKDPAPEQIRVLP